MVVGIRQSLHNACFGQLCHQYASHYQQIYPYRKLKGYQTSQARNSLQKLLYAAQLLRPLPSPLQTTALSLSAAFKQTKRRVFNTQPPVQTLPLLKIRPPKVIRNHQLAMYWVNTTAALFKGKLTTMSLEAITIQCMIFTSASWGQSPVTTTARVGHRPLSRQARRREF